VVPLTDLDLEVLAHARRSRGRRLTSTRPTSSSSGWDCHRPPPCSLASRSTTTR
jgi:hypothetical protein